MAQLTGGAVLIEALRRNGVDTIFDIPGDPMGSVTAAGHEAGMQMYSFRHEQAVTMAAQAYTFVSRRLGVGLVASGPAMTNAITGLTTAWANCWPTLLVGGTAERSLRGLGDFQETPQVEAAAPFCKWSVAIDDPRRIPWFVNSAIRRATNGRPGPVYLDFPSDVINTRLEEEQVEWLSPVPDPPRPLAEPGLVAQAAREIERAERPLLLFGKGAAWADASDEARDLVDRFHIPFVPSPMGKGLVPDGHPLCAAGARSYALSHADLVILVGARFNWLFHFGRPPRFAHDVKVVQIEIEPSDVGNSRPATVGLVGDAKMVLGQLVDALESGPKSNTEWIESLREEAERNAEAIRPAIDSDEPFTNLYRMFREIGEAAPANTIYVDDGESTMAVSRVMQSLDRPRRRLDAGVSGCMGTGVPYAVGAQVAEPGSPVVCISGDYAFGWNGMEIETACRYGLPITFVVANNGTIRQGAPRVFNMRGYTGEDAIRYDRMMEAFGGHAEHVATTKELRPALDRAFESGRTSLINVVVDPDPHRKKQEFGWLDRAGRMSYS